MGFNTEKERPVRRRSRYIGIMAAATLLIVLSFAFLPTGPVVSAKSSKDGSLLVYNETLGFGAVLLLSLPDRTDRRDAMSLLTSLYNVSITHTVDAVRGSDISEKALPFGEAKKTQDTGHMGSWRSHMDIFKYIVDNRIETALVLEDDVDWDTQIHSELLSFSRALRTSPLRGPWTSSELARAPYGLDWDFMHFANAYIDSPPPPFQHLCHAYHDPYRNPLPDTADAKGPIWHNWNNAMVSCSVTATDQRVIIPDYASLGLAAIAVSFEGAQRLLHQLSWLGLEDGLDWSIRKMIEKGILHGWTVAPPLMGTWTVGDSLDSDINMETSGAHIAAGSKGNKDGKASNIAHSARAAMGKMLEREEYWTKERFGIV